MGEVTITLKLHVDDGEEAQTQMARDIRRALASRKALKRLLNAITVIQVEGPGMTPRSRAGTPGERAEPISIAYERQDGTQEENAGGSPAPPTPAWEEHPYVNGTTLHVRQGQQTGHAPGAGYPMCPLPGCR